MMGQVLVYFCSDQEAPTDLVFGALVLCQVHNDGSGVSVFLFRSRSPRSLIAIAIKVRRRRRDGRKDTTDYPAIIA